MSTKKPRATSQPLTRDELRGFARAGVRASVVEMERTLARLCREYPEVFINGTAPVFVAPEEKPHAQPWPALTASDGRSRVEWTAERRAVQAERIRARLPKMVAARRKKIRERKKEEQKVRRSPKGGEPVWARMREYLATREDHRATSKEITKAIKANNSAAVPSAFVTHPDLFERPEVGVYQLTKAGLNGAEEE